MSGEGMVPSLDLLDHYARPVSLETFKGRHVLVFFGFTHCRMVCPRALGRLSEALEELGDQADQFTPLYVTVDPERDDPARMRVFLSVAAPRFTGLTGAPAQIDKVKEAFGVFTRRRADGADPDGYAVAHTALTYVLDPRGRYRTHLGDGLDASRIASRLRDVLATG